MGRRLIIDGNAVYEIDEDCMKKKEEYVGKGYEERKRNENTGRRNNVKKGSRKIGKDQENEN